MKTPEQIAEQIITDHFYYTKTTAQAVSAIIMAIEADRAQRSKTERFGLHVYSLMNEVDEWNADVFEDIAGIADRLGIPFDN